MDLPTIQFSETPLPAVRDYTVSYRGYVVWLSLVPEARGHYESHARMSFTSPDGELLKGSYFECDEQDVAEFIRFEPTTERFRSAFQRIADEIIDEHTETV